MKKAKTYRIDQERLNELEKVKQHLQTRYETASETLGTPVTKATDIDALEFAIKFAFDKLKEEGYIQ